MTGRFALAALLVGCSFNAVAANQPISADARAAAALTDLLPPPAPLTNAAARAARNGQPEMPLSNLRRGDFVRAVWVDGGDPTLQSLQAIRKLVADCRAAGFNAIYALVRSGGIAAYMTDLSPRATTVPTGFDPLAALLAEAHSGTGTPIQVHAWMKMARVGGAAGRDPRAHVASLHPDWMTRSHDGKNSTSGWLDLGAPAVREHLARVAGDLAGRYAVDGIVLEDAGYAPGLDTGYQPDAVQRFQKEAASAALPEPADNSWIAWRRSQVAECTKMIRQAVREARPQAAVALASIVDGPAPADRQAYTNTAAGLSRPLDAWPLLAENATVDTVLLAGPQGASTAVEASVLEEWTAFALQSKGAARLVIGVQARPKDAKYTAALMLDPILEPRADGVAVLPGNEPPLRMEASIFRQLFDPTLVEARAARSAASADDGARDAGMPRLSDKERLAVNGAPAPVAAQPYLQIANPPPAGAATAAINGTPAAPAPAALPPMATPGPIGPGAASLPPIPAPAPAGAPMPALPPPPPAPAPEGGNAPVVLTPNPANQLPVPDVAPAGGALSLPPVTATPPPDAVAPLSALPPLAPTGAAPAELAPPVAVPGEAAAVPPVPLAPPPVGAPAPLAPGATVDIPAINDNTNFTGAPVAGGPTRVSPTITPPSIRPVERVAAPGAEALGLGHRAAIAAPQFAIPDFSDPNSVFVPRTAPPVMREYAPPPNRPSDISTPVPDSQLEVIMLTTGKEFVGRVVERGPVFRIQMPNGGIVKMEAGRIAGIRAQSKPLDVKPLPLP